MRNRIPHNKILEIYKKTIPSMRYNGEENFFDWQKKLRTNCLSFWGWTNLKSVTPYLK